MSSMKDIKQRISNVGTTRQIIRAMDMVAATKLHKARLRLDGIRPLYNEMQQKVAELKHLEEACDHVFVTPRKVKKTVYVVITSNKGLCGSYNNNVAECALKHMNQSRDERIIVVGAKGLEFFRRHGKHILHRITDIHDMEIYEASGRMANLICSLYLSHEADEVYLAYTHFESTLSHLPLLQRVLPLPIETDRAPAGDKMIYEPDVCTFIDHLVPLYMHTCFFAAAAESVACEYAARMINMDAAGKNATEVIDNLKRMYNRKRQAAITQELNEIIGGANILE
ncbi:F-type H+-transporting ATPase subunit gamma [Anaerotaenia torta]|uniref:ATP synthase F1 subunit gamma n=1 Tax=Anaerotaenia torta TaxID=433293 RepID=UPI003D1AD301